MDDLDKRALAEFVGTFAVVFFGCGALVAQASPEAVAAVFGLVVMAMIYAFGHVSGAHFNPAVTLGFFATKKITARDAAAYGAAQCSGAILAAFTLKQGFPLAVDFGTTSFQDAAQAFFCEVLLSFFLMLVISAVASDEHAPRGFAGVVIGATVAIGAVVGGPVSGASMNPARTLGPAVATGSFAGIWIYLSAPFCGTLMAARLYQRFWSKPRSFDSRPRRG